MSEEPDKGSMPLEDGYAFRALAAEDASKGPMEMSPDERGADLLSASDALFSDALYDVAIIGAGPAGAALATHLARRGCHVVALDRATFPREKPCAEYLSPAAEPLLADLGALDEVLAGRHARLRGFRIFAPNGSSFQGDFAPSADVQPSPGTQPLSRGEDVLGPARFETGLAVPRSRLDTALVHAARRAGAEVREGWRLADVRRSDGLWHLIPAQARGEERDIVRARLLVGADGVHSAVARRLGLAREGMLRRVALVAHVRGITGLDEYGEMHVAGGRYVGLARLSTDPNDDLCNVAMVVDEARDGRALAGRTNAFLLEALAGFPALRARARQVTIARDAIAIGRLQTSAVRLVDDGVLLVGDAAGYYDPFTGEGIYRALRGAHLAAPVIHDALRAGDVRATRLSAYEYALRQDLRGRHLVEQVIQLAVSVPPLLEHFVHVLARHKRMADTIIGVTGDFLPPTAVLRPSYILRLVR